MRVTLPYDPLWRALAWAKQHCTSYITTDQHCIGYNCYDSSSIDYYFADEKDATLFLLRWA